MTSPTHISRLVLVIAAAATVIGLAACGGSGGTATTGGASTTATEGSKPAAQGGAEAIFRQSCSSCHKLAAAGATFGEYGPDLDQLEPSEAAVKSQVESGGGIMPAFGKSEILTPEEIEEVSRYVATEAGK